MNVHLLFTPNAAVIANMRKLIKIGDTVILLDEGCTAQLSDINGITIYTRENAAQQNVQTINDPQWLALCDNAQLIHSWY